LSALPPPLPTYIESGREPLFAVFHGARPEAASSIAALICPPFGWEEVCSYRSRREWADSLAGAGHPVLRIDLPGAGDSGGSPRHPGLLDAWGEAISASAAWLRAASGCERVVAVGIGLGGLLACGEAAAGAPIDDLVLWGVPAKGRTLARELRAFTLLNPDGALPGDADPPPDDGSLETGGFVLTAETIAALGTVDLTKLDLPDGAGRRVLMLEREGIEVDARLRGHLEASGADVSVSAGPGYGAMMAHPQEARAPREVFETVEGWLAAVPRPSGAPARVPAPPVASAAELTADGKRVRETAVEITQPFGRMSGVLTEPLDAAPGEICAVLFNAGALRRIGPGRMWVEIARRWAGRGVPTLRIDLEGIGDADGQEAIYADVAALYVPELVEQARAALGELHRRDLPERLVLCGLCSGAYWAFQAALSEDRVQTAFLVNPRALWWDDSLLTAREARKGGKVVSASLWRRVIRGQVSFRRIVEQLRVMAAALVRLPAILLTGRSRRGRVEVAFDQLREEGKRLLLIFGELEPLQEELAGEGLIGDRERWPNVEVVDVPGHFHSLEPITAQRRVHDLLDAALAAELGRSPAAPATGASSS